MRKSALVVSSNIEHLVPCPPGPLTEVMERDLGRPVVKLHCNESPLGASPLALARAAESALEAHRYPEQHKLRAALARHHGVQAEEIVLGNGSNELLDLVARTFAGEAQHAVYPHPSFVVYRSACSSANIRVSEVALREHLHYDVDALLRAVMPDTGLLFLANPNNPTGSYLGRDALERLLREVPPHVLVVVDEAYVEFADAHDFVSAHELRALRQNLLVLRTFSKAFGLAALRVGYGVGAPEIVGYLDRVRAPYNVSSVALAAALGALEDLPHVARYVELNRRERRRVAEALVLQGLRVAPSQANFLLVNVGCDARCVSDFLLRLGILVRAASAPLASWLRITLGLPEENDRLLAVLPAAIAETM